VTLHEDDLDLGLDLVRALVDATLPDLAALPLRPLEARGSSNALFRLGDDLLVRLPRQPGGSATIEKEARWLPQLARHLPVAVPEIVAVGPPQLGYPERWSVVRWITSETNARARAFYEREGATALAFVTYDVEAQPGPPGLSRS